MSLSKRFRNLAAAFLMVLSTVAPMGGALVRSAYAETGDDAPAHGKTLIDNGDGTYTIALSVTGQTSSSSQEVATKANVIFVLDTSSSMNKSGNTTTYNGQTMSWLNAEQHILADDNGIIDQMLAKNTTANPDIVEIALVNFGERGSQLQDFTYNAATLKSEINNLGVTTGTNWEEGLQKAKSYADSIKTSQPNEDVYIIFMTDGEPTTHANSYNPNNDTNGYQSNWGYAKDDARNLVTAGYKFYGIFTWGKTSAATYLSSLVQYAYTGSGTYNTALDSQYAEYYMHATDSGSLVNKLVAITNTITTGVGYTNIELTDGVTEMTTSNVKATAGGAVTGLKYYRSGGDYGTADFDNGNYGTEWADAPAATINDDGEVDWNLGNLVLEDGVTYTVTFVVWPSQESVDLVADLNNGKISYDSLEDDQKSQIFYTGSKYILKTNTDYPTLTYSTVTTTTDSSTGQTTTVTSDPTTINIENPDPVDLYEAKMTVEKKWDDSLDPSQREEVNGEVVLDLMVDGETYIKDIELSDENDWKIENYVNIAPGLMVSSESPAYDASATQVTYDGVTYAILETGHDYVFSEKDINSHFELTAYSHHPMLVNGTLTYVTFTYDDEGKNITGISDMYEAATLSATNTIKGGINITKELEGVDTGRKFEMTVYMASDETGGDLEAQQNDAVNGGSPYTYDYRIWYYNDKSLEENGCTEGGYKCRSDHHYGTGNSFTESIRPGDVIRVVNVANGTYFYVAEDEESLPLGYTLEGVEYEIGTKSDPTADDPTYDEYSDEDTATINGEKYYVVKGNFASQATVKNKYDSADLKISKIIDVIHGDEDLIKAKTFKFNVTLKDGKNEDLTGEYEYVITKVENDETVEVSTGTIAANGEITLGDGETATINDLPVGAKYIVEEQEVDGFTKTVSGDESGTLAKAGAEVAYTNTYDAKPVSTQIIALKDFNDWTSSDAFTFEMRDAQNNLIGSVDVTEETKQAVFNVKYTTIGEYTYTIKETAGLDNHNGTTNETPDGLTVTVKVEDDGEGNLYIVGNPEVVSAGTITNTYKSAGSLELAASKILTGRDWQDGDSFTFYLYEIVDNEEVKKGEVTLTSAGEVAFTTISYETSDRDKTFVYVIREAETEINGITNETGDLTITVTLTDDHQGNLTTNFNGDKYVAEITNSYSTNPVDETFGVAKTVTDSSKSAPNEQFTFKLQDLNGEDIQTKYITTNTEGSVEFNPITYTEAGTYKYQVVEVAGDTNGYSYDDTVYYVTVVVKDDTTKAQLYVDSVTYSTNKEGTEAVDAIAFENTYEATPTETQFNVTKTLSGFEGETPATFTFEMTGDATDTITIDGEGLESFETISYDEAGEYHYVIKEVNSKANGYTYDASEYKITVEVKDENGALKPYVTIMKGDEEVDEIKFENTYAASGDVTLKVQKDFAGNERDWSSESFTFELTGDEIEGTMTADATADGWLATFDKIEYKHAGTYHYTITEKDSGLANVKASDPIEVVVEVVDNGDGTLTATPSGNGVYTITNTYTPDAVTAKLQVEKEIDDQSESGVDGTFEFTLTGKIGDEEYSDTVEVKTNDGSGSEEFKEMEFTAAGEYTFTLKETKGNEAGYTYDEDDHTVVIVVSDNTDEGKLEIDSITNDGKVTITNIYKATAATYELKVKKTLNGLAEGLDPAVFSFELTGDETDTKKISGAGEVAFGPFTYETTGTHNYTITETKGSAGGYSYDGAIYTIEVEVVDEGGKLVAKPTIKKDGESATSVEFVNVYKAEGSIDLYVTKDVQGRPWLDSDEFEFTLFDESGEAVGDPVTVDSENKTAKFTLTYSEKDHNQKYNYTISETGTLPAGMTKPADITATVSVTDNGDGTMKVEATDGGKYTVVNSYKAEPVDTTIRVNKKIDDQSNSNNHDNPIGGTFYFTLEGEGYSDYQSVGLRSGVLEGGVDFKAIEFTEAGTYTYTLQEAQGALGNFTYDTNEYTVLVVVEDNYETGKLEVKSVTIEGDETKEWTITNIYKADPVDVQFEVTKVLNGMNDGVEPVEFEFELTGDGIEEAQTVTIKGAGSEKFDPITFEQTGTYKYEIVEIDGGAAGYLYDIAKYIIEVTVTDEGGKLVADVQIKKDGQSASNVTFENNYEATPITDYVIEVNKVLEGRELREGEFSFTLYDEEGNEVMTVLNDVDGKVTFDGLSFEKPGTYVFTVKENANENNSDVEFDENEYTITIVVKDNGEGELVIESDDSSDVTFTNIYHEPGRGDTPENPKTEDGIMRNIAMLAISVLGLIGTVVFGKRKLAEDEE